jgi:hypothetical protein
VGAAMSMKIPASHSDTRSAVAVRFAEGCNRKWLMKKGEVKKKIPENTAQQTSNSEGEWLDKIKHAKSIAVNIDKNLKSEKTAELPANSHQSLKLRNYYQP